MIDNEDNKELLQSFCVFEPSATKLDCPKALPAGNLLQHQNVNVVNFALHILGMTSDRSRLDRSVELPVNAFQYNDVTTQA